MSRAYDDPTGGCSGVPNFFDVIVSEYGVDYNGQACCGNGAIYTWGDFGLNPGSAEVQRQYAGYIAFLKRGGCYKASADFGLDPDVIPGTGPCASLTPPAGGARATAKQFFDDLMLAGSAQALALLQGVEATAIETQALEYEQTGQSPREYAPVSVRVSENTDSRFIEPLIEATYFDCVSLRIGGDWVITDYSTNKLYFCTVKSRSRPGPGLLSYTFVTPMTLLNNTEPPSLMTEVGSLTPKAALEGHILPHFQKVLPRLTWAPVPEFYIRTGTGESQSTTVPTVPVVHLVQEGQQPKSIREFLETTLSSFDGYAYRMDGWRLQIIAPSWAQESPALTTLTDDDLISMWPSENDDSIINTQKVTYRPWEFVGDFEDPDSLETIAEPSYYRVGFTEELAPPDNRRLVKNEKATPWALNMAAKKDKVLVTWTAYVFAVGSGTLYGQPVEIAAVDISDKLNKKVHTFEMTREGYYIAETTVRLYINKGNAGIRDFFGGEHRTQFARSDGVEPEGNFIKFRWRLEMKQTGVTATLLYPSPETIFKYHSNVYQSGQGTVAELDYQVGAEFHLDVRGVTFQQSAITYSATYGVHIPAVGVEPSEGYEEYTDIRFGRLTPKAADYVPDEIIQDSYELYGRREGKEIVIEVWTLTLPTERDLVGEPIIDWNADYNVDIVAMLTGIAETVVKNHINPTRDYALELSAPFKLAPAQIATLVALPEEGQGDLAEVSYAEAHAPGTLALTSSARLSLLQLADIRRFASQPSEPPERVENELTSPPPPTGPVTEDPNPPAAITVTGSQDLELPFPFLLKSIDGPNGSRLRLFRTAAARTADTSRAAATMPPEDRLPLIISDDTIETGNHLDLHATISHTTDTKIYALAEGGTITLNIFRLEGQHE